MTGKASVGLAIDSDERCENLFFISAPMNVDITYDTEVTPKLFEKFISDLKKEFDYVVLDMAAGTGKLLDMARESALVDDVFVVSTQNAASIRAAEKLGTTFSDAEVKKTRLIINSFDPERVGKGDYVSIMDVIDHSSITLMGVVPYDKRVERLLSSGKTVSEDKKSKAGIAIMNIAKRTTGEGVALLEGIIPKNKRLKYY
jgi:septum site-determining protein MinD